MVDSSIRMYKWLFTQEKRLDGPQFENLLRERLRLVRSKEITRIIKSALARQYYITGQIELAREVALAILQDSNHVVDWMVMAEKELYFGETRCAKYFIDTAIDLSFQRVEFRRYSLGVAARIALKEERYVDFEDIVNRIADLGRFDSGKDCGIETDFVERAPSHALSDETRCRYLQFAQNSPPHRESK